jgi:hypothetical protein
MKINYDTAIRDSFSAQAAVCLDSSGSIIQCSSLICPPCTAVYGEASAVRLAVYLQFSSFILEGDSLIVTLALQNRIIHKTGVLLLSSLSLYP